MSTVRGRLSQPHTQYSMNARVSIIHADPATTTESANANIFALKTVFFVRTGEEFEGRGQASPLGDPEDVGLLRGVQAGVNDNGHGSMGPARPRQIGAGELAGGR